MLGSRAGEAKRLLKPQLLGSRYSFVSSNRPLDSEGDEKDRYKQGRDANPPAIDIVLKQVTEATSLNNRWISHPAQRRMPFNLVPIPRKHQKARECDNE